jgi:hypothetical protein
VSAWAWAAEKGSGAGVVAEKRAVVGASTTESVGGRLRRGVANRRGPRTSEGERQTCAVSADRKVPPSSE